MQFFTSGTVACQDQNLLFVGSPFISCVLDKDSGSFEQCVNNETRLVVVVFVVVKIVVLRKHGPLVKTQKIYYATQ